MISFRQAISPQPQHEAHTNETVGRQCNSIKPAILYTFSQSYICQQRFGTTNAVVNLSIVHFSWGFFSCIPQYTNAPRLEEIIQAISMHLMTPTASLYMATGAKPATTDISKRSCSHFLTWLHLSQVTAPYL